MISRNHLSPTKVCEVGCGAGEILNQLYQHLPSNMFFTGFDISPQAYELAKEKAKERLHFFLADFLRDNDEFFDLLLVIDVIEHIEDCFTFLRSLHNRGKYKIFHIPLDMSLRKVLLNVPIARRRQFGHIHYFMKETALATLSDTGYKIVDYFYTSYDLDFSTKSMINAMGKLVFRIARMLSKDMTVRILGGHSLLVLAE